MIESLGEELSNDPEPLSTVLQELEEEEEIFIVNADEVPSEARRRRSADREEKQLVFMEPAAPDTFLVPIPREGDKTQQLAVGALGFLAGHYLSQQFSRPRPQYPQPGYGYPYQPPGYNYGGYGGYGGGAGIYGGGYSYAPGYFGRGTAFYELPYEEVYFK